MRRLLFTTLIVLALLLVSCDQFSMRPTSVTVRNNSDAPVFWQLRKLGDPESDVFHKIETGCKMSFYIESKTDFVMSFAGLASDSTVITDDILVINQTSGNIRQIEFNTVLPKEKIEFDGSSSDLNCKISFKPL